ncbi:MAG: protein kinase domain-containing protein [Candidatus Nanopelagicales bacterium]
MSITEIAGYRVIRQLGAGGMGQVFLVQHPRLPRQDALKLLDSGVSRNDDFKARFQREADLLAQLSHPNIVTLHDRGEFEDRLWITMEYVDGTDASELLRAGGPVDVDLALSLVAAAGAALDYAWRKQRITHRDVKPANILVGIDETHGASQIESVKLADFGIAKAAGESTSLTTTGMTIGTMQYISPEAIEGEVVDNRSDIYSLGCTAFHLLTGQPPFTGTSIASTMSAHLTKPVRSASALNEQLPDGTDAVFERVLAKNPDDRYQSCAEFVTALQESVGGGEVRYPASAPTLAAAMSPKRGAVDPGAPTQLRKGAATPPPPQRKSRAVPILASAVGVLAAAAALLGVYATRGGSGDTTTTDTPTTASSTPLSLSTTSSLPPAPPPVLTTTAETVTPVPTQTRTVVPTTVAAAPTPYEGMPCTMDEAGQMTADGALICNVLGPQPSWRLPFPSHPAVQLGTACAEPGVRARVVATDGIAKCQADSNGNLFWSW